MGFPGCSICLQCRRPRFNPWGRYPGEGNGNPVFFPGEFYGQRSLVGYSLWGHKDSDMNEWLTHTRTHTYTHKHFSWLAGMTTARHEEKQKSHNPFCKESWKEVGKRKSWEGNFPSFRVGRNISVFLSFFWILILFLGINPRSPIPTQVTFSEDYRQQVCFNLCKFVFGAHHQYVEINSNYK